MDTSRESEHYNNNINAINKQRFQPCQYSCSLISPGLSKLTEWSTVTALSFEKFSGYSLMKREDGGASQIGEWRGVGGCWGWGGGQGVG